MQLMRSIRESVDLTRLSRIALNNLEKEEGVSDYTAAQPAAAGGDITIDSADAELDFEETQEEGECGMCLPGWGASRILTGAASLRCNRAGTSAVPVKRRSSGAACVFGLFQVFWMVYNPLGSCVNTA
jgi:hypothetical protein